MRAESRETETQQTRELKAKPRDITYIKVSHRDLHLD
jgi:hypothetical protein